MINECEEHFYSSQRTRMAGAMKSDWHCHTYRVHRYVAFSGEPGSVYAMKIYLVLEYVEKKYIPGPSMYDTENRRDTWYRRIEPSLHPSFIASEKKSIRHSPRVQTKRDPNHGKHALGLRRSGQRPHTSKKIEGQDLSHQAWTVNQD